MIIYCPFSFCQKNYSASLKEKNYEAYKLSMFVSVFVFIHVLTVSSIVALLGCCSFFLIQSYLVNYSTQILLTFQIIS